MFEELNGNSSVTTIIHHNNEEMMVGSTDGFDIKPVYFASDEHIARLKDTNICGQVVEVYCHFSENRIYRSYINGSGMANNPSNTDIEVDSGTPDSTCSCPFVGNCDTKLTR